ncbi:MAG: alpha-mannosidase [Clostridia bacterium]|nr:alpha-mannosidase [Clostridia bacterium]
MYFPQKHCEKILGELDALRFRRMIEITGIRYLKGNTEGKEGIAMDDPSMEPYKPGDAWGLDRDNYLFRAEFTVPAELDGETLLLMVETSEYGNVDPRIPGGGLKWNIHKNPQFLMFQNGEPWHGIDKNHNCPVITHYAAEGEKFSFALDGFPGMAKGSLQLFLKIAVLDRDIDRLYFNLKVPLDVADRIDDGKTIADILGFAEKAVNMLDMRKPYSDEFNASVAQANDYLETEFYGRFCGDYNATVSGIGHTHIDVAWLWPLAQTRQKAARSFSTVLNLMKDYPEYLFMSSQPQLYDFVKKDKPGIYEKIKERIAEGRWEPEGGMWLEADCNITGGESFVRQLLFGTRFFKEEFNAECKVLWLPDVFGYSAALPQILRKSGIEYFMTTKIFWNEYNRFPYETFLWEGMDGSTVLSHFITATDTRQKVRTYGSTYNARLSTAHVKGAWDNYNQKEINDDVLISFGYGDGGGGPTREMLEEGRRLAMGVPGCPKFEMKKSRNFFEQLDERVRNNPRLPKWVGELYLEYHRGTYTSVGKNKWYNRKCEFLLRDVELFSQMAASAGLMEYPRESINSCWETVLLNQFHDILPGSSIAEVYEESQAQYSKVMESLDEMLDESLALLAGNAASGEDKCVVFNQLSHERHDEACIRTEANFTHAVSPGGEMVPGQIIERDGLRNFVFPARVPSMGYSIYKLVEDVPARGGMYAGADGLENDFIKLMFDVEMNIVSIYDKCNRRELVKAGERANQLIAFEDKPINWDAWDINIYYNDKKWEINDVESVEIVGQGPVAAGVRVRRRFLDSTIEQTIVLHSFSSRIDFDTRIDWHNDHILLKAAFPMDIHTAKASYEIQYGNVERPTHWNTSWDYARFEVCAHKWADISEDGFGVSLMNDCKYGHDIKDSVMRLTLLKSATLPSPVADEGLHQMVYSIMPHAGGFREGGTVGAAYELNCPLHSVLVSGGDDALGQDMSFASIDKKNIVIEAVKRAEDSDDILVRLYECFGQRTEAKLSAAHEITDAYECDLMENRIETLAHDDHSLAFTIKPYEIKTFMLKF